MRTIGIAATALAFSASAQVLPRAAPDVKPPLIAPGWTLVPPPNVSSPYMASQAAIDAGWPLQNSSLNAAGTALARIQTESIRSLLKRIDDLEARVKELEGQSVAKR